MRSNHFLKFLFFLLLLLSSELLISQQAQSYETVMKSANERFEAKDYLSAKTYYEMALRQKADDPVATKRLTETIGLMKKQLEQQEIFYNFLDQGDKLFNEGAANEALAIYKKALSVFPDDKYVNAQVNKIESANKEKELKNQQFEQYVRVGKQLSDDLKLEEALFQYNLASDLFPDNEEVKKSITALQQAISKRNADEKAFQELMLQAFESQKRKNFDQAITKVNQALAISPTNQEATAKLTELQILATTQKKYDEAIVIADQAYEQKKLPEALDLYRKALVIWPGQAYASEMVQRIDQSINSAEAKRAKAIEDALTQADTDFDQKQYDAALANYNTVLGLDPDHTKAGQRVIELTLLISAEKVAQQQNKLFETKLAEANSAFDKRAYEQALTLYQNALELKPDNQQLKEKITSTQSIIAEEQAKASQLAEYQKYITEGDQLFNTGKLTEAKIAYEKAVQIDAAKTYPASQIASINNTLEQQQIAEKLDLKFNEIVAAADALFKEGKFDAALTNYREALSLKNGDEHVNSQVLKAETQIAAIAQKQQTEASFNALLNKAAQAESTDQLGIALENYTQASVLKPEDAFPKEKIAAINIAIAKKKEADQRETNFTQFMSRANELLENQNYIEAVSTYEQALALKPNSTDATANLKRAKQKLDEQKANAAAEEQYNQTIGEADLLFDKGDFDAAIQKYQAAQRIKSGTVYPAEQIALANKKLEEKALAQQKLLKINSLTAEADQLFSQNKLVEADRKYKEVLQLDSENTLAAERTATIAQTLATQAKERQANYDASMAKAEQLISVKEYKQALSTLNEALGYMPDDKAARQRITQVESIIEERLLALKSEYNKVVNEADRFYNTKSFDQAIEKYLNAEGIKPDESYPREMIRKIAAEMEANKIREVNSTALLIPSNTSKRFDFEPVDITERRSNYVLIKARNTGEKSFPLLVNFGSKSGRNGGFVLPIPENGETNDFIVRVGQQYKWFSEDNTWLELLPENGSVEVTIIQISKSK